MSEENKKGRRLFIPGFMFVGLGVGIIIKNAGDGILLELGVGFIIYRIIHIINR